MVMDGFSGERWCRTHGGDAGTVASTLQLLPKKLQPDMKKASTGYRKASFGHRPSEKSYNH
jgi:hypothetical protein